MNDRRAFYNKLIYLGIIAALLLPLNLLGRPSAGTQVETTGGVTKVTYTGGALALYREVNHLSQSSLGKIDPVSESFKLATLGLRPVAVVMLWEKSHYYKKVEDWSNYTATLEQIKLLQPNYISVWDFLSHGIAFNLSVEFDNWRHRYYYVIKGLQFLIDGTEYNANNALLLSRIGWFITQKMGKSDDHLKYRAKFAEDSNLHEYMAQKLEMDVETMPRDSWLVGKRWYEKGVAAADLPKKQSLKTAPTIYYSYPGMAQIDYANCLEEEGNFDHAKEAWEEAAADWETLGKRPFSDYNGGMVRLNDREEFEARAKAKDAELEKLVGQKMTEAKPDQRQSLVALAPADKRGQARRLAEEANAAERTANTISSFRGHVNFDFWRLRCEAEMTPEAIAARKLLFEAIREQKDSSLIDATKQLFEQGFAQWRIVIDKYPALVNDPESEGSTYVGDDLYDSIKLYRKFLAERGEKLPKNFVLQDVIDRHERRSGG